MFVDNNLCWCCKLCFLFGVGQFEQRSKERRSVNNKTRIKSHCKIISFQIVLFLRQIAFLANCTPIHFIITLQFLLIHITHSSYSYISFAQQFFSHHSLRADFLVSRGSDGNYAPFVWYSQLWDKSEISFSSSSFPFLSNRFPINHIQRNRPDSNGINSYTDISTIQYIWII